eukprot:8527172-Alexandrium_andersonii.AAC.1
MRPKTPGLQALRAWAACRGLGRGNRPLRRNATKVNATCGPLSSSRDPSTGTARTPDLGTETGPLAAG